MIKLLMRSIILSVLTVAAAAGTASAQSRQFNTPEYGTEIEMPIELLRMMNETSSNAWQKILSCAGGNAAVAQQMYHANQFGCTDDAEIKSMISDLRASLPTLASTVNPALFMNPRELRIRYNQILDRVDELSRLRDRLYTMPSTMGRLQQTENEIAQLERQAEDLRFLNLRTSVEGVGPLARLRLPHHPMNPFFSLVLSDELASLGRARGDKLVYANQLTVWLNATDSGTAGAP